MESINIKRKEMRLRLRRTGSTISGSQVYKRRMSPKRNLTHPRLNIASIDLHDYVLFLIIFTSYLVGVLL